MTLAEKLKAAILAQQAEVDRLKAVVDTDLKGAQARMDRLLAVQAGLTPEIERGYVALQQLGIKLDT